MRRALGSLALVLSFCCALSSTAEGAGRAKGKKSAVSSRGERGRSGSHKRMTRRKQRPPAPPPMPSRLEVLSIEPKSGSMRVALLGPARPPETRLFVITDERGRRFVPATAECTTGDAIAEPTAAASAENAATEHQQLIHWQCELTVAPLYRRAALTGVSMEWGDRIVSALPGQVRARWAEGPTNHPAPPPKTTPEKALEKNPDKTTAPPPSSEPEPPSPPVGEDDEETDP